MLIWDGKGMGPYIGIISLINMTGLMETAECVLWSMFSETEVVSFVLELVLRCLFGDSHSLWEFPPGLL